MVQPEQEKCKPESHVETAFASNAIPACFSRELLMRCFIHTKSVLLCSLPVLIVLGECRRSSADLESSQEQWQNNCATVLNMRIFGHVTWFILSCQQNEFAIPVEDV